MSQLLRMVCVCIVASAVVMGCGNQVPAPAENAAPTPKVVEAAPQPTPAAPPAPQPPKAPVFRVVKSWNFQELEAPHWQWVFPRTGAQETPQGAFYHAHNSGLGPQLTPPINLEASEVSAIRVYLQVMRKGEEGEKPTAVELTRSPLLLWASAEDLEKEDWVYSDEKRRHLELVDPENPYLFQVDLRNRENWQGEIARLAVGIPLPEELDADEQPYNVFFRRIEFLK